MRVSKKSLLAWATVIAIAALAVWQLARPRPGTVAYHIDRLGRSMKAPWQLAPKERWLDGTVANAIDYIYPKTWLWVLSGRPTIQSTTRDGEEHQQALIRLGYFERREVTLKQRELDAQFWPEFRPAVSNAVADWRWCLHIDESRPTVLRITAPRADVQAIESIIKRIDHTNSHGAAR